jgi:hypothetical protein
MCVCARAQHISIDAKCKTCTCGLLDEQVSKLFFYVSWRGARTYGCLSWLTKTRQHGGVNVPAFRLRDWKWLTQEPLCPISLSITRALIFRHYMSLEFLHCTVVAIWYLKDLKGKSQLPILLYDLWWVYIICVYNGIFDDGISNPAYAPFFLSGLLLLCFARKMHSNFTSRFDKQFWARVWVCACVYVCVSVLLVVGCPGCTASSRLVARAWWFQLGVGNLLGRGGLVLQDQHLGT